MRGFTSHNNVTKKLTNKFKEKLGILSLIRNHRKVGKQGRSPTPADNYTSEHIIPNSVLVLGID